MNAETKFNELVAQFESSVESAVKTAIDSIHSDMVPYLNDDNENNARYRAIDIVKSIINGNFELDDGSIKVGGWKICNLTNSDYDKLVDKLASIAGDKAKDLKIERLERQISEMMQSQYKLGA